TDRLFGRITIPEYGSQGCHWLIGRQLPTSPPPRIARSTRYLGLSLARPLLGYEHALTRLSEDLEAILVVEHALDWLYPLQWKLPVLPVSCVGPQVSSSQLASLLDLMQRAGKLPIVLGRDIDMARRQASVRLQQQLWRRGARVGVLPLLEGVSSLGELGQRPDGRAILEQALRTAFAQFPMQASTHHQQQEGS
ncbi:MAG: hypothetical protein J2P37_34780, partial [Ktedonobacteraceae bacterium]|nr:hypothetical protein [Ktedonobacteraceae bacterium]